MFRTLRRLWIARVSLALMLFAQAAMGWSACMLPERAPERALQAAVEHAGCEQMADAHDAVSTVCLAHCLAEKQSLNKAALDIPPMPANVMLVVPGVVEVGPKTAHRSRVIVAGTGPPRRILLQSFQV